MDNIDLNNKTILITGAAGFIGANLAIRLLRDCAHAVIVGVDDVNDYYDPALKEYRLGLIAAEEKSSGSRFVFRRGSIADAGLVRELFAAYAFDVVVNLAAQAGVRHLVYASSSSVYGGSEKVPFSTEDPVDRPVSLYAATKKSNELLTHAYGKLYGIPSTGLRFFTVYGPAGRPDMFYFSAAEKLRRG